MKLEMKEKGKRREKKIVRQNSIADAKRISEMYIILSRELYMSWLAKNIHEMRSPVGWKKICKRANKKVRCYRAL